MEKTRIESATLVDLGFEIAQRHDHRDIYSYYDEPGDVGIIVEFVNDRISCLRVSYSTSQTLECALPLNYEDYDALLHVLDGYGHKKATRLVRGFKVDQLFSGSEQTTVGSC